MWADHLLTFEITILLRQHIHMLSLNTIFSAYILYTYDFMIEKAIKIIHHMTSQSIQQLLSQLLFSLSHQVYDISICLSIKKQVITSKQYNSSRIQTKYHKYLYVHLYRTLESYINKTIFTQCKIISNWLCI